MGDIYAVNCHIMGRKDRSLAQICSCKTISSMLHVQNKSAKKLVTGLITFEKPNSSNVKLNNTHKDKKHCFALQICRNS